MPRCLVGASANRPCEPIQTKVDFECRYPQRKRLIMVPQWPRSAQVGANSFRAALSEAAVEPLSPSPACASLVSDPAFEFAGFSVLQRHMERSSVQLN